MIMKRVSHVEKMKARAAGDQAAIMQLLGWDETRYFEFQYETGCAYLRDVLCPGGYGYGELCASRMYWRWWINGFNRRNDAFLHTTAYTLPRLLQGHEAAYVAIHSTGYLADTYPHRAALESTYARMIGKLLDSK